MKQDITMMSAIQLAQCIREQQITVVEVVTTFLEKIDRINPKINAFVTIMRDEALQQAHEADQAIANGQPLGVIHGVPVAIKDLTPVKDVRYTMGSKLFEHQIADRDAIVVERIRAAGGIIIGKTNTPEFGHKGTTDNLVFGASRNPWHLDRITGGSSGGSSAAVAAGLVPLAEGTDGGGSIRIPAALCGVFGYKPTYGKIPMDIFGPFSSQAPFLHYGPIARTVEDATLLYDIMAGPDTSDAFTTEPHQAVYPVLEQDISSLKVAYSKDFGFFNVTSEVQQACDQAAETFRTLGCQVDDVTFAFEQPKENIEQVWFDLWCGLLASSFHDLPPAQMALLEPKVQEWIALGAEMSATEYLKAYNDRDQTFNALKKVLDEYDVIITPTTAMTAFPIAIWGPEEINGEAINPMHGWFLTYLLNLTGHPAASLPVGFDQEGLPIGLQIIGNRLDDATVLQASRAFERVANWYTSYEKIQL